MENTVFDLGGNVKYWVEENTLIISCKLDHVIGKSQSGMSTTIATTKAPKEILDGDLKLSLTLFAPIPEEVERIKAERKAAKKAEKAMIDKAVKDAIRRAKMDALLKEDSSGIEVE